MAMRYVVHKAPHVGGPPIPEGEPCLVIRAQDRLAGWAIRSYIERYLEACPDPDNAVIADLVEHRLLIDVWQLDHPVKWPDR